MEGFIDNNTNDHYELFELPFQIQSSFLNSHSSFGGSHASSISVASPLLIQRNPSAQKPRPVRRLNSRPSEPVVCWPVGKCCERIDLGSSQLQGSRWSLERNHGEKNGTTRGRYGSVGNPIITGEYGSLQGESLKRYGLLNESRAITSEWLGFA